MGFGDLIFLVSTVWPLVLAALALGQRPRTLPAWVFTGGMLLFAVDAALSEAVFRSVDPSTIANLERWRLVIVSVLPCFWLPFSLFYSRGNYREFLAKWRIGLGMTWLLPIFALVMLPHLSTARPSPDAFDLQPALHLLWAGRIVLIGFLIGVVLILMNFERTLRASVGTQRWRIKYAIVGLVLLFAVRFYTSSQELSYSRQESALAFFDASALFLACLLVSVSFLRTSFSGTEVYPSLALLQNSFVVLLAGGYLLVVGLLAKLAVVVGGDRTFPIKSFLVLLSFVALGLALISERTRFLGRRWISRNFRRPLYDYRMLWRQFAERTSAVTDERSYCRQLVNLISETLRVLTVTVWLVDEGRNRLRLVASTSLSEQPHTSAEGGEGLDSEAIAGALAKRQEPFVLDGLSDAWVLELKRSNPVQFMSGGNRVCVPLWDKGQFLGLLVVGDRVNGIPLSIEDFELLRSLGDHAANGLLNLQLAQRLYRAREMEAFQSMAAFFVHDLKNTASSLSLMLQNLPAQMENPAFRQDALRAVSKSVARINDLITRLGLLREGAEMKPVETDLPTVIRSALEAFGVAPGVKIVRDIQPTSKLLIDPEQIQKVAINLLTNAREAVGTDGEIRVASSQQNGWGVLTVRDNGCGISPEFLSRSLFRPFQTTKKTGIGIGMFHCKTIVEAHQGRIEVESQPGKGTTFRVLLPLSGGSR